MSHELPPQSESWKPKYVRIEKPEELVTIINISSEFEGHSFGYTQEDVAAFSKKLQEPHSFQVIAQSNEDMAIGYLAGSESLFPGHFFITELLIDRLAQGKGIGTSLIEQAISHAKSEVLQGIYTETEEWNHPAQSLYERCGFKKIDNLEWTGGPTYYMSFES